MPCAKALSNYRILNLNKIVKFNYTRTRNTALTLVDATKLWHVHPKIDEKY